MLVQGTGAEAPGSANLFAIGKLAAGRLQGQQTYVGIDAVVFRANKLVVVLVRWLQGGSKVRNLCWYRRGGFWAI